MPDVDFAVLNEWFNFLVSNEKVQVDQFGAFQLQLFSIAQLTLLTLILFF